MTTERKFLFKRAGASEVSEMSVEQMTEGDAWVKEMEEDISRATYAEVDMGGVEDVVESADETKTETQEWEEEMLADMIDVEKKVWEDPEVARVMSCTSFGEIRKILREHGLDIVFDRNSGLYMAFYPDGDVHVVSRKPLDFTDPVVACCRGLVFTKDGVVVSWTSRVASERVDWDRVEVDSMCANGFGLDARERGVFVCPNGVNVRAFLWGGKVVWVTYKLFESRGPRFVIETELEKKFDVKRKLEQLEELGETGEKWWLNFIIYGSAICMSYNYGIDGGVLSGIGSNVQGNLVGWALVGNDVWVNTPHLCEFGFGPETSVIVPKRASGVGVSPENAWKDLLESCILTLPGVEWFERGYFDVCRMWMMIPASIMTYGAGGDTKCVESKLLRTMNVARGNCYGLENVLGKIDDIRGDIMAVDCGGVGVVDELEKRVWLAMWDLMTGGVRV